MSDETKHTPGPWKISHGWHLMEGHRVVAWDVPLRSQPLLLAAPDGAADDQPLRVDQWTLPDGTVMSHKFGNAKADPPEYHRAANPEGER